MNFSQVSKSMQGKQKKEYTNLYLRCAKKIQISAVTGNISPNNMKFFDQSSNNDWEGNVVKGGQGSGSYEIDMIQAVLKGFSNFHPQEIISGFPNVALPYLTWSELVREILNLYHITFKVNQKDYATAIPLGHIPNNMSMVNTCFESKIITADDEFMLSHNGTTENLKNTDTSLKLKQSILVKNFDEFYIDCKIADEDLYKYLCQPARWGSPLSGEIFFWYELILRGNITRDVQ